jgi:hypothetical protein
MKKRQLEERIVTKREACHLLKIQLKDLELFEKAAKVSPREEGYTHGEFSRLCRSAANFHGVKDEEEGIGG